MDLIVYGRQIRTSKVGTRANRVKDIALRKGIYYATSHVTINILALILDIFSFTTFPSCGVNYHFNQSLHQSIITCLLYFRMKDSFQPL